jgi:hypothetical protein
MRERRTANGEKAGNQSNGRQQFRFHRLFPKLEFGLRETERKTHNIAALRSRQEPVAH